MKRTAKPAAKTSKPADVFAQIAKLHLDIDTLDEQGRDSLDFHEVSVMNLRDALEAAYAAGIAAAKAK